MERREREQRFGQALAEHGAALARLVAAYERRPALREELLQEIALALWQALPAFRGEASLKTFVLRVATNRAMTHLARRPPATLDIEAAHGIADDSPSPQAMAEQQHAAATLQRAVAELSLPLKQVMSLALEGLGTGEIAEVLGISESNAAVRLHRGKALVRARLGGQHG